VAKEVSELIIQSNYPDLEIKWYMAEIVQHERAYRMEEKAIGLLPSIEKLERLLGHNLNITEAIVRSRVQECIKQKKKELGLVALSLDYSLVDWGQIMLNAAYRLPPFSRGETEKGFRDALLVEAFIQLVAKSPSTPKTCLIAMVTNDALVEEAVSKRTASKANVRTLKNFEGLKDLINTLISEVDEDFINGYRPKATKLFFDSERNMGLIYREKIIDRIEEQFKEELETVPKEDLNRQNEKWLISEPTFLRKQGAIIYWNTRISVRAKAYKTEPSAYTENLILPPTSVAPTTFAPNDLSNKLLGLGTIGSVTVSGALGPVQNYSFSPNVGKQILTHKGYTVFDVIWSAVLTTAGNLTKLKLEKIKNAETKWEEE